MRKVQLLSLNYHSTGLKGESKVGPCNTDIPPSLLPFAKSQEIQMRKKYILWRPGHSIYGT